MAATRPTVLSLDDPRWCSLVTESAAATPFHQPAWAKLLSASYGYHAFVLGVTDGEDRLQAAAPFHEVRSISRRRRWISLPFTDECPPLARDPAAGVELAAALAAARKSGEAPAIELRAGVDGFGWRTETEAVIHELELDADPERLKKQKQFRRSQMMRYIRRAEREQVLVRRATDIHDLRAFYALHTRTRRRQGVPVQPRRFFDLLWERLVTPGLAFILLADVPGREAIAGALFLTSGGNTVYKFGASDPDGWRFRPNHLILWTAIREACERGDRRFDFGRTDLDNKSLRVFKSNWGAQERPLAYSKLGPSGAAHSAGVASRALSLAIRRGPQWVCRSTGATLYRYAASR